MPDSPSLFELAAREHANSHNSKSSRAVYNADLDRWLTFCRANNIDPAAPTLAQATAFKDHLQALRNAKGEPFSQLTVRRVLATLSAMYVAVMNEEHPLASWNPWRKLRVEGDSAGRTKVVSADDAEKVMAAAANAGTALGLRDALIMRLMFETGIRRQSVVTIRRDDIYKRDDGKIIARVAIKGSKREEVVLAQGSIAALDAWLEKRPASPYLFPALRGGGSLHVTAVNKVIAEWSKTVGVKISPHRFRAAFITAALDAGVPLHEVQAAVHHRDPKTTLRYDRGTRGEGVSAAVSQFRKGKT